MRRLKSGIPGIAPIEHGELCIVQNEATGKEKVMIVYLATR